MNDVFLIMDFSFLYISFNFVFQVLNNVNLADKLETNHKDVNKSGKWLMKINAFKTILLLFLVI